MSSGTIMAAAERPQRASNHARHPVAGALYSNSVPSTPLQHASDLRFSSRSPSPGRLISGRRSPTSAALHQTPKPIIAAAVPAVCKFESGAEFRKRRVPYKDGGNEPLPPPQKKPKKALSVEEDDKLSADMRRLYEQLLPSEESEQRKRTLIKKLEKILEEEWPAGEIKVHVFGSSGNLLSSSDSDVDICITTSLHELESMHSLAMVLDRHGMQRVVCRAAAKVPIVKMWDPELQLACDMNVNNTLALENTRMIKTYVQIDERVRPLAKIVKYWTKQRILNDAAFGGTISSYTWICMILNFLQCRKPPILPSLQEPRKPDAGCESSQFEDNVDMLKGFGSANHESLGALLFHFFRYYAYEVDYQENVISVRAARLISRKEKGWNVTNYQDKEARSRLCVEEPFNINRNLGNSADDYAFSGIHEEIRRAFELVAAAKLEECCEAYVFPPEEKSSIFQRPVPKPKPILTRSASQQGRSHANSVGAKTNGRDGRSTRASSTHRGSSRRASSGATFGPPRFGIMSPTLPLRGYDYLGTPVGVSNDHLHEQLSKQYQALQARQEILTTQLLQQQQNAHLQAAQARGRLPQGADLSASSPRQRQFPQQTSGSRPFDATSIPAPLLPGYLYHYPARYNVVGSPLMQSSSQDGSWTQPSSPLLASRGPALRRSTLRSTTDSSAAPASVRSQSQPGRSLPSPATLQSITHPGYDVSGAIGTSYLNRHPAQVYPYTNGFDAMSPVSAFQQLDHHMPKEYVGYYVHQSPQMLLPNMVYANQVPRMRDVPLRHAKVSPDRAVYARTNGAHAKSRSPSPMYHQTRLGTVAADLPIPSSCSQTIDDIPQVQQMTGPIVLNGSTPQQASHAPLVATSRRTTNTSAELADLASVNEPDTIVPNGVSSTDITIKDTENSSKNLTDLPLGTADRAKQSDSSISATVDGMTRSAAASAKLIASPRYGPSSASHLAGLGLNGTQHIMPMQANVIASVPPLTPPLGAAPLLSPVAEMQSPPPSRGHDSSARADGLEGNATAARSPTINGHAPLASVWTNRQHNTAGSVAKPASTTRSPHPVPLTLRSPPLETIEAVPASQPDRAATHQQTQTGGTVATGSGPSTVALGQWQQATTKRHRKNKSLNALSGLTGGSNGVMFATAGTVNGHASARGNGTGEAMPFRESERKGG